MFRFHTYPGRDDDCWAGLIKRCTSASKREGPIVRTWFLALGGRGLNQSDGPLAGLVGKQATWKLGRLSVGPSRISRFRAITYTAPSESKAPDGTTPSCNTLSDPDGLTQWKFWILSGAWHFLPYFAHFRLCKPRHSLSPLASKTGAMMPRTRHGKRRTSPSFVTPQFQVRKQAKGFSGVVTFCISVIQNVSGTTQHC